MHKGVDDGLQRAAVLRSDCTLPNITGALVEQASEMGFDGVLHVRAHHVDADIPLTLSAKTGATLSQSEVNRELDQVQRSRRRDR